MQCPLAGAVRNAELLRDGETAIDGWKSSIECTKASDYDSFLLDYVQSLVVATRYPVYLRNGFDLFDFRYEGQSELLDRSRFDELDHHIEVSFVHDERY